MGEIATTVKDSLGLDTMATNLLAGGKNVISPTLKLGGEATPVIKVAPLSSKEFTDAILRPISPETLSLFMKQGWDAEFLLPLVVAGYRCGNEKMRFLSGEEGDDTDLRLRLQAAAPSFEIVQQSKPPKEISLLVTQSEALEMLSKGIAGYSIDSVTPEGKDKVRVKLKGPETKQWGAKMKLCPVAAAAAAAKPAPAAPASDARAEPGSGSEILGEKLSDPASEAAETVSQAGASAIAESAQSTRAKLIADQVNQLQVQTYNLTSEDPPADGAPGDLVLRSVEGIIYYLGERLRACYLTGAFNDKCAVRYTKSEGGEDRVYYLFRVQRGDADPDIRFTGTKFYGTPYWIGRLDPSQKDRTVKTVSFINQLIALQTDRASVPLTPTVLTIGQ